MLLHVELQHWNVAACPFVLKLEVLESLEFVISIMNRRMESAQADGFREWLVIEREIEELNFEI